MLTRPSRLIASTEQRYQRLLFLTIHIEAPEPCDNTGMFARKGVCKMSRLRRALLLYRPKYGHELTVCTVVKARTTINRSRLHLCRGDFWLHSRIAPPISLFDAQGQNTHPLGCDSETINQFTIHHEDVSRKPGWHLFHYPRNVIDDSVNLILRSAEHRHAGVTSVDRLDESFFKRIDREAL